MVRVEERSKKGRGGVWFKSSQMVDREVCSDWSEWFKSVKWEVRRVSS
jgi:hypothetical protein